MWSSISEDMENTVLAAGYKCWLSTTTVSGYYKSRSGRGRHKMTFLFWWKRMTSQIDGMVAEPQSQRTRPLHGGSSEHKQFYSQTSPYNEQDSTTLNSQGPWCHLETRKQPKRAARNLMLYNTGVVGWLESCGLWSLWRLSLNHTFHYIIHHKI